MQVTLFRRRERWQGPAADRDSGFTLIELLIVIVIIGILAAIAIPAFLGQRTAARHAVTTADLASAKVAVSSYQILNGTLNGVNTGALAKLGYQKSGETQDLWVYVKGTRFCLDAKTTRDELFTV